MKKHFVIYFSPGTFLTEQTQEPIDLWDVDKAVEMSKGIKERHGVLPYGFCFVTRERGDNDLDSHEIERSGVYFLGGKIPQEFRGRFRARGNKHGRISGLVPPCCPSVHR